MKKKLKFEQRIPFLITCLLRVKQNAILFVVYVLKCSTCGLHAIN